MSSKFVSWLFSTEWSKRWNRMWNLLWSERFWYIFFVVSISKFVFSQKIFTDFNCLKVFQWATNEKCRNFIELSEKRHSNQSYAIDTPRLTSRNETDISWKYRQSFSFFNIRKSKSRIMVSTVFMVCSILCSNQFHQIWTHRSTLGSRTCGVFDSTWGNLIRVDNMYC